VVYLIGEVLAFLLAAGLIGAAMAWTLRSLRSQARERRLCAELEDMRAGRETAEARVSALEASIAELRLEREREAGELRARIAEFENRLKAAEAPKPSEQRRRWRQWAAGFWRALQQAVSGIARLIAEFVGRLFRS
jgi:hypothetical protein